MDLQEIAEKINLLLLGGFGASNVAGILLTMCDARTNLCRTITEQVAEAFRGQVRIFDSRIPHTVKVGESVYYSEPLLEYAPGSSACAAYEDLAKEVAAYEG